MVTSLHGREDHRDALIKSVVSSLEELHEWREEHNGRSLGRGIDPPVPDEPHDYAEAYALWGRGYCRMYELTGDQKYLDLAAHAAAWLLENQNPGYENPSWGLPWRWAKWDAPPTLSYLVTTSYVGLFLLDLHLCTRRPDYLDVALRVGEWMEHENGGEQAADGWWLYYANYEGLRIPVVNPSALASGFFARLHSVSGIGRIRQLSVRTAAWVFGEQKADGLWPYSATIGRVDNVHTGFTLEGLIDAQAVVADTAWELGIERGLSAYWRHLYTKQGKGWERKPSSLREVSRSDLGKWAGDQLWRAKLLPDRIPETRLWGYAAGIRPFSSGFRIAARSLERAKMICRYLIENLKKPDGSFAFRRGDTRSFIRHEAHLFDALGCLALALGREHSG